MPHRSFGSRPRPRLVPLLLAGMIAGGLFQVAPAHGGGPAPAKPIVFPHFVAVGEGAGNVPDPLGEFTLTILSLIDYPIAGSYVVFDFSNCTDLQIASNPEDPDATVDCSLHWVGKYTDAEGHVTFRIVANGSATPGSPGSPANCVRVYADGVTIATPSVATLDLTGGDGLTPADVSAWLDDYFSPYNPERADFDGDGALGPNDLSFLLDAFFAGGSITNQQGGGPCPP